MALSDLRVKWRRETQQEADERAPAEAEADPAARRKQAWAIRYAHLRLSHSMVLHKKNVGKGCSSQPSGVSACTRRLPEP